MSKYIKEKSLSVGFNPESGQAFFDTLLIYKKYIKEYFFDISRNISGELYNENFVYSTLAECDTYDIPANLLFNNIDSFIGFENKINRLKGIVNLQSVTVLDPSNAVIIKEKYPDLEIHLSVRFWDWGRFPNPIARVEDLKNYPIDVINISGVYSFNDQEICKAIHDIGMKVKFIVNEGCIIRKDMNYSQFPEFKDALCRTNPFLPSACLSMCRYVHKQYPWMELSRVNIFKESLQYYPDVDILKISGRHRALRYVINQLEYWTSDNDSTILHLSFGSALDISKHYDLFLDYIKTRSECSGYCYKCQRCKKYWEEFTEGVNVKNILQKEI